MDFIPSEIIEHKKMGGEHSPDQIRAWMEAYVDGEIKDYHMAAWAMAVWFRGMTPKETAAFTEVMLNSGRRFDFSEINKPIVDKHSTGGVGDKASLILAPIVACAGIAVPMISGRGLGHTGGTLDKLESIPGFRVRLTMEEFTDNLIKYDMAMMGQTDDICPADKKFYSLRDVTSTVDSLPLICGSIMSKKIAEDLNGLVLDVKFGSGAFMKTIEQAEELAQLLMSTGQHHNLKMATLITSMDQPLGRFAGNSLEIKECLEIMAGKKCEEHGFDFYENTREVSLQLAAHMIWVGGKADSPEQAYSQAVEILDSGQALKAFEKLCEYQGPANPYEFAQAQFTHEVKAPSSGFVSAFATEDIGWASLELGAGRKRVEDQIDPAAGIEFHCQLGQKVKVGQTLYTLYSNDKSHFALAEDMLLKSTTITEREPKNISPLIAKVLK